MFLLGRRLRSCSIRVHYLTEMEELPGEILCLIFKYLLEGLPQVCTNRFDYTDDGDHGHKLRLTMRDTGNWRASCRTMLYVSEEATVWMEVLNDRRIPKTDDVYRHSLFYLCVMRIGVPVDSEELRMHWATWGTRSSSKQHFFIEGRQLVENALAASRAESSHYHMKVKHVHVESMTRVHAPVFTREAHVLTPKQTGLVRNTNSVSKCSDIVCVVDVHHQQHDVGTSPLTGIFCNNLVLRRDIGTYDKSFRTTHVESVERVPEQLEVHGLFVASSSAVWNARVLGAWTAMRGQETACLSFCQVPGFINDTIELNRFINALPNKEELLWAAFTRSIHSYSKSDISLTMYTPEHHGHNFIIFFVRRLSDGSLDCVGALRADLKKLQWTVRDMATGVSVIRVQDSTAWHDKEPTLTCNSFTSPSVLCSYLKAEVDANIVTLADNDEGPRAVVESCIAACERLMKKLALKYDTSPENEHTHYAGWTNGVVCSRQVLLSRLRGMIFSKRADQLLQSERAELLDAYDAITRLYFLMGDRNYHLNEHESLFS